MQQFRKARMEELDAIMALINEAKAFIAAQGIDQWQGSHPGREHILQDIQAGLGYVIYDDGIAAYAALVLTGEPAYASIDGQWLTQEGQYATAHRFAVGNQLRHTGIGSALIENLERVALMNGMLSLRADTHRGNAAMNAFLKKNGFTLCGQVEYRHIILPPNDPIRLGYEKLL